MDTLEHYLKQLGREHSSNRAAYGLYLTLLLNHVGLIKSSHKAHLLVLAELYNALTLTTSVSKPIQIVYTIVANYINVLVVLETTKASDISSLRMSYLNIKEIVEDEEKENEIMQIIDES